MKKILITGANGQLGKAMAGSVPDAYQVMLADRQTLNIADETGVSDWIDEYAPDGIVNTAAYTAVDKAEQEPELARAVNTDGPKFLAAKAAQMNIPLVHVSTDFVFSGGSGASYKPDDPTDPLSVYGVTKMRGEEAVLATPQINAAVVRTAWVYDAAGKNFVNTMLRLMKEKDSIGVVADQIGSPTYVNGLAEACWTLLDSRLTGIYHWTDAGVASWYDFAVAIQEEAFQLGVLKHCIPVRPLTTSDFPTPAARPLNSVLDKSQSWQKMQLTAPHWRHNLRKSLAQLSGLSLEAANEASIQAPKVVLEK